MDAAKQPTNLLVTFLEYCSVISQDIKGALCEIGCVSGSDCHSVCLSVCQRGYRRIMDEFSQSSVMVWMAVCLSGSMLVSIEKVILHRAWSVLGSLTIFRWANQLGMQPVTQAILPCSVVTALGICNSVCSGFFDMPLRWRCRCQWQISLGSVSRLGLLIGNKWMSRLQ